MFAGLRTYYSQRHLLATIGNNQFGALIKLFAIGILALICLPFVKYKPAQEYYIKYRIGRVFLLWMTSEICKKRPKTTAMPSASK